MRIERSRAAAAAALRDRGDVRCLLCDDALWLRGADADEVLLRRLDALPRSQRFLVGDDGRCTRPGRLLPTANVPAGEWQPVAAAFLPTLPTPALAAIVAGRVELRVVRGGAPRDANVLQTTLQQLQAWLDRAAAARFEHLRFCADADGRVLVHGAPMPPLPGVVGCEHHGVALAAGHRFEPDVPHELVAQQLLLQRGDLAWWSPSGEHAVVRAHELLPLRRRAVRATLEELRPR